MPTPTQATLTYLRQCIAHKDAGYPVSYTTDVAWLVHMAINRRAGWLDDPTEYRGSARPVRAHAGVALRTPRVVGTPRFVCANTATLVYPKKATGNTYAHLRLIARKVNSRTIVHAYELGEWRKLLTTRIPTRIADEA